MFYSRSTVPSGAAASSPARVGANSRHRQRAAFTLIELLVVIAIIAILAAILFPVFAQAREKARQTSCISNEKQLVLAIVQYEQDYDEQMPARLNVGLGGTGWGSRVYPYVKSTQVYKCPDDPTVTVTANGINYVPVSYAINADIQYSPALAQWNSPAVSVLITEVKGANADVTNVANDSSTTYQSYMSPAADGGDGGGAGWIDWSLGATYATGPANLQGMGVPQRNKGFNGLARHVQGSNFGFADGHAKYLQPLQLSPGYSNSNPACDQDYGNTPCSSSYGNAAGTSYVGSGPEYFRATYSPI